MGCLLPVRRVFPVADRWSFTTLPVAAKYNMTSVADFLKLETAFTAAQFIVVAPLMALSFRGTPAKMSAGDRLGAP
jgi:hypothetical protein